MEDNDSIFSDINYKEVEASYIQRLLSSLIDIVLSILLLLMLYKFLPVEITIGVINSTTISRYIFIFLVMELYRLILLLVFGKTIGMMVCQIKYLNAVYQPLSTKEKFKISIVVRTSAIRYYKNR